MYSINTFVFVEANSEGFPIKGDLFIGCLVSYTGSPIKNNQIKRVIFGYFFGSQELSAERG